MMGLTKTELHELHLRQAIIFAAAWVGSMTPAQLAELLRVPAPLITLWMQDATQQVSPLRAAQQRTLLRACRNHIHRITPAA